MEQQSPIDVYAGPLRARFEPQTAMLRYLRVGDVEVLRGIYCAVRDHNWDTVMPAISNLSLIQNGSHTDDHHDGPSFEICFDVECRQRNVDFVWHGFIEGRREGLVRYQMDGEAHTTFQKNRIGFCVLHPIHECAGEECFVTHVDGTSERTRFPKLISPQQPFLSIRAIRHHVTEELDAEVRFYGDEFEMEDQRNWTDASFKAYCTPLASPFPVTVEAGERLKQCVEVSLSGDLPDSEPRPSLRRNDRAPASRIEFDGRRLPPIGLCSSAYGRNAGPMIASRLRRLNLSHLQVDLRFDDESAIARLKSAARQALDLEVSLDVAITLTANPTTDLGALLETLRQSSAVVAHLKVFHTDEKSTSSRTMAIARQMLGDAVGAAKFVGGTNAYFAELNRGRPEFHGMDAICFSVNPQVHAVDDASIMETLEAQSATIQTARTFCGDLPIHVGPVTLKPRFNPNATTQESRTAVGELPPQVDCRQAELFGAAWTVASLGRLAAAGAARLTYFETVGWLGVMETAEGCPLPSKFLSIPGGVYPLYHVLADVGEFAGAEFATVEFGLPLELCGLALRHGGHTRLIIGNLSNRSQTVPIPVELEKYTIESCVRILDNSSRQHAMAEPERWRDIAAVRLEHDQLELGPYSVATVDYGGRR